MEQEFTGAEVPGVAKAGDPLQFIRPQVREHRIHLQNDRKFDRFIHCNAFQARRRFEIGNLRRRKVQGLQSVS
jgi:hypothetical protein